MIKLVVSIIVPVFNMELHIQRCLESIVSQTYQHLEIILVNDGSTDSSPRIIDEYASKDSRIIAIHKDNGGIGSAYKAAFEIMTGDYVLFVDSDDWLELDAVENLVKLAVENDADMVSFGMRPLDNDGKIVQLKHFENINEILTTNKQIIKNHYEILKHPTLVRLYRNELFKDIIIFEQNIGIDEMLTPQLLLKCNKAVYSSNVFYNVLIRKDSVCRSAYTTKKVLELVKVNRFVIQFMENNINSYVEVAYLKYVNTLFDILHQSSLGFVAINNETIKLLQSDLKTYFIKLKRKPSFQKIAMRNKIAIIILLMAYNLYSAIIIGYKKTKF